MKLNRRELRKIIYDFNSISNRLLQANYDDYNGVLSKFISFLKNTLIIYDYILDCGQCDWDLEQEFQEIGESYGQCIFALGDTDEEEIRNVFAVLSYIVEKNLLIHHGIAMGYSNSRHYQDKVKGFNDRVVMVLIRHIECYLTKIGIDMGVDEKISYSITVHNGQVNIANDEATINATNTNDFDNNEFMRLLEIIKDLAKGLSAEDKESLECSLEVIEEEYKSCRPRKSFLKTAITGLTMIKGSAEFAAAVTTLIQFINPLIGV